MAEGHEDMETSALEHSKPRTIARQYTDTVKKRYFLFEAWFK